MYNRYIPQADGSYRRNRVSDPTRPKYEKPECPPPPPAPEPECPPEPPVHTPPPCPGRSAGDFLRRLLPKDLDTGDLLVIILLLLMAGDKQESNSTALLTLALYLFL